MCPNYFASNRQSLCLCHPDGLMCPSVREREFLCTARFESCSVYVLLLQEAARARLVHVAAVGPIRRGCDDRCISTQ
jgi:hypothetical protein